MQNTNKALSLDAVIAQLRTSKIERVVEAGFPETTLIWPIRLLQPMLAGALAFSLLCGCGEVDTPEEVQIAELGDTILEFDFEASSQIEVVDESGLNSVTLSIFATSEDVLEDYITRLQLVPLFAPPEGTNVLSPEADENSSPALPPGVGDHIAIREDAVALADGVIGYGLKIAPLEDNEVIDGEDYRGGFNNYYYYSYRDCAEVTRNSFWRKVGGWIYAQPALDDPFSLLRSDECLDYNQTILDCSANSYQTKVRVRSKKTSAFVVNFHD